MIKRLIQWSEDFFEDKSISKHIIYFEILLFLISATMIGLIYFNAQVQMKEQEAEYVYEMIEQKSTNIKNRFKELEVTMIHMTYNPSVIELLQSHNNLGVFTQKRKIDEYITQVKVIESSIERIIFYNAYIQYNKDYDMNVTSQIEHLMTGYKNSITPKYLGIIQQENEKKLVFAVGVYDSLDTLDYVGNVIFVVNENFILKELHSDFGDFIVHNSQQTTIFSGGGHENLEISKAYQLQDFIVFEQDAFTLTAQNFEFSNVRKLNRIPFEVVIFIIFVIAAIVLSYFFIMRNVIGHLQRIHRFIQSISKGDFRNLKKRLELKGAKEIVEISDEFNQLLDEINRLTTRLVQSTSHLYKAEISKKEAELSYLKSQINPHFLYNTLNVVKGIAVINQQKEIEIMTMSLVNIFRYSIKGDEFVPLCQEVDVIKAYVKIQEIRFENSFSVSYDIEEHLVEMEVLKMILQPLLENAIQYGVETMYEKNHITVCAKETEKFIELSVSDDGKGIHAEKLAEINRELLEDELSFACNHHIGLLNVHHRIKHYYGQTSGVTVASQENIGTTVTIYIDSRYIV